MLIRRITKTLKLDKWWIDKIGSGVFTFLLFEYLAHGEVILSIFDLLLFVLLAFLAVFGHFINDYSDYESDKEVGKTNVFNMLPVRYGGKLIVVLGSLSIALSIVLSPWIMGLVVLQMVCNMSYSLRPLRIKERGILALLLTGLYERMLPLIIIIVHIVPINHLSEMQLIFSVVYLLWSYLWECRNFLNGQLEDYENDKKTGTNSIVIDLGKNKVWSLWQNVFRVELVLYIIWLGLFLLFNAFNFLFPVFVLVIQVLHTSINKKAEFFSSIQVLLAYVYRHSIIAGFVLFLLILSKINVFFALILLYLFRSVYAYSSFRSVLTKVYYFFRFYVSKVVNYSIYYFRKYVLRWSEEKSRGEV